MVRLATQTAPLHEPMLTLVRELQQRPAPPEAGPTVTDGTHIDLDAAIPKP